MKRGEPRASETSAAGVARRPLRMLRIGLWVRQQRRWGRDLIAGAFRHANRQGRCEIRFFDEEDAPDLDRSLRQWRPDGLILSGHLPELLRAPHALPCPIALVNLPAESVSGRIVARLRLDDTALSYEVADRFLRRGFRSFAYVGAPDEGPDDYSSRRRLAFTERIRSAGAPCAVFSALAGRRRNLGAWLAALPKPCGLMSCNDERGKDVLDICRRSGIRVPEQVSVVSVDDDTLFCETCDPPLSSIRPDHEKAGFRAAQLLCAALENPRSVPAGMPEEEPYGAECFSERASSQDWRGSARLVSAARAWIDAHAREGRPLHAAEIAAALNVSVRLLHLRFRETGGGSLREAIEEARLVRVCALLRSSDAPVDTVAAECGFASPSHLAERFRRRYGLTMARWRALHRSRGGAAARGEKP